MKKITFLLLTVFYVNAICAQTIIDTLSRYGSGNFLLKLNGRYELRNDKGLTDWWENMNEYITINNKVFQLIKRKDGDKWKTGLFQRKEGKLILHPEFEKITNFFDFTNLIMTKSENGLFVYSLGNGNITRAGFKTFRRFGNDCLAFNDYGVFIYSDRLELKDSIGGFCPPKKQLDNGSRSFLFLDCTGTRMLVDDHYSKSIHSDWDDLITLEANLLVVKTQTGEGVFHIGQNRLLTSCDHEIYLHELHETRFMLFKDGNYILYDSAGKKLAQVQADAMSCVDELQAFFYHQNNLWKVMNASGKALKTPDFDDIEQSKMPIGNFWARIKGEKKRGLYSWIYSEMKGEKIISGIQFKGEYKENDPSPSNGPPNNPIDTKND